MISVEEADTIIREYALPFPNTLLPLQEAIGRILREDIHADRDMPPYHRVTMDGIAIQHEAFQRGLRNFQVEGLGPAGAPQTVLNDEGSCIEIMTGAILPENTDTVIRYEDVRIEDGMAFVRVDGVLAGQNIHRQGTDRRQGELVIEAGTLISAAEIGVAASVGKDLLRVADVPRTIIVSTGDELVEVNQTPLPYQIRKSNVHRLQATLRGWGISTDTAHLPDEPAVIRETLSNMLEHYSIIILSGGVSKGKFDYLPKILEEHGVEKLFHRVRQRPGKPFWFGRSNDGVMVFAMPGNPVSSFLCTLRYFKPWLETCLGQHARQKPCARLAEDVRFLPDLTYFLQVRIKVDEDGQLLAFPVQGHGSGDLANLVDADAFLELPSDRSEFKAGEVFPFWPYREFPA